MSDTDEADDDGPLVALPDGWTVWSDAADRTVLVYRPDVFDGEGFPAPCLPTIDVARGRRGRRPGPDRTEADTWFVRLYLEPDVEVGEPDRFEDREAALDAAVALADRFVAGTIDHRAAYQVPREAYLDELDRLLGDTS
ncbi:hypothetical protein BRD17_05685 [Halobacteriales archaeon SW_7_68_16]|nr:MAG: hypothetical protein BRD17_05685 [Halobacteriales archaeon SW_7_68_16]